MNARIHGSSYIPPEYQQHMKCIVDLEGVESADDAPDTSYYQWVTFMLLFQAGRHYWEDAKSTPAQILEPTYLIQKSSKINAPKIEKIGFINFGPILSL